MFNNSEGLKVTETSTDAWVVQLLQALAEGVSEFARKEMAMMHKEHPRPQAITNTMQILPLQTSIGAGKDKQIEVLFNGPQRKLVQITLRENAVLAAHKAAVPITIQCVAGCGILTVGTADKVVLQPGVLVTMEPNLIHEITAQPAVSILLTQFIDK